MTDRIREKLNSLRNELETAVTRAEDAEKKSKKLEQSLLEKEQECTSLNHRLGLVGVELEKSEAKVATFKTTQEEGEHSKSSNEALNRKVQLLEEELDAAERNLKETVEKLRQVDVKAEQFERQIQRLEQERDAWETKYEDMKAKYEESKKELDDLVQSMGDL